MRDHIPPTKQEAAGTETRRVRYIHGIAPAQSTGALGALQIWGEGCNRWWVCFHARRVPQVCLGVTGLVPPHPLFPFPADITGNAISWSNGSCSLELTCQVARGQDRDITYSWRPATVDRGPSSEGPKLSLYLDPWNKNLSYKCTVQDTSNSSSLIIEPYQFCRSSVETAGNCALGQRKWAPKCTESTGPF